MNRRPFTTPSIVEKIDENAQLAGGREQSGMSGDAAVRVERVTVVRFTDQYVVAPLVPRFGIAPVLVGERCIVDHVMLVHVPLFRRRESV